jgi:eukaryotic-like serine/threonine-protein kinase
VSKPAAALSAFHPSSLVGTTLDGRYDLAAHLATGGMGAVFRARHVHLRKDVALKVLRPDLTSSPDIVERFRREAEIASALEHDNIVRVTDFGSSAEGYLFLVMELLTGESLFDRLRREGFLPPEEAVPILWQVCAGLEAAHALGVVHRDLKPENVFLARTSSGREVTKILDFGIAKIAGPASGSATQAGIVVGTPEYLSPEQATGSAVDARADLYAVGLIAWRTLVGHHPFKADEPRGLLMMQATRPVPPLTEPRPDFSEYPALVSAVAKACAKEPGERHPTAAALREELARALGPAFLLPPGATPAPSMALSPSPLPTAVRDSTGPVPPPAAGYEGPTMTAQPRRLGIAGASALAWSELRAEAPGLLRGARQRVGALLRRAAHLARTHPRIAGATLAGLLVASLALSLWSWQHALTSQRARDLLEGNRPVEARAVIDAALERRPGDRELLLLRGRALHRSPGQGAEAIEAYATARAAGPLDEVALDDLVASLGRERRLADRATRVLFDEGQAAVPAVLRAATSAPGAHRLRALALARDLGAEDRVDRVEAYGDLLFGPECDVRRLAARRLGEIGDPQAIPRLRRAAQAQIETKAPFGKVQKQPACGAPDADAAARRIEAARLR